MIIRAYRPYRELDGWYKFEILKKEDVSNLYLPFFGTDNMVSIDENNWLRTFTYDTEDLSKLQDDAKYVYDLIQPMIKNHFRRKIYISLYGMR